MGTVYRPTVYGCDWMADWKHPEDAYEMANIPLFKIQDAMFGPTDSTSLGYYSESVNVLLRNRVGIRSSIRKTVAYNHYGPVPCYIRVSFYDPSPENESVHPFSDFWRLAQVLKTDADVDVCQVLAYWVFNYLRVKYWLHEDFAHVRENMRRGKIHPRRKFYLESRVRVCWPGTHLHMGFDFEQLGDRKELIPLLIAGAKDSKAYTSRKFADFFFASVLDTSAKFNYLVDLRGYEEAYDELEVLPVPDKLYSLDKVPLFR